MQGKPWRSLLVGKKAWTIWLRSWISGLMGKANTKHKRIFLKAGQDEDDWEDTLLHEVLHAAVYESGAGELLDKWSGGNLRQSYGREERFVRKLTPTLLVALKELGWQPPKEPE